MPDPQGWTVQWGVDVRASLPFIASGGVGRGVYVTGFTAQDELGFYVDLSGNKYETSNGTETFGGDIGFVGRSLALGVRAAETFDFVIGVHVARIKNGKRRVHKRRPSLGASCTNQGQWMLPFGA